MTILWCGGEDIDFINPVLVDTTGGRFRSGYARCGLSSNVSGLARSVAFSGGAISSGWLSCRVNAATNNPVLAAGLANNGQNRGLCIGGSAGNASKAALRKIDGSTITDLATESGLSLSSGIIQMTLQIVSLGVSGVANVFVGGTQVISYSGDLSWLNNPDCVGIQGSAGQVQVISEIVVADEDTRLFSLVTQAPNAAGDSNAWTGAYTDINEITIDDSTILYTNTTGQDAIFNLIDLPTGVFTIRAVRIAARAAKSASATAGSISLGVKSGGTVNVDTAHACATAFTTIDRLMTQNPVTSNNWLQSEMDTLQVAFRSAT